MSQSLLVTNTCDKECCSFLTALQQRPPLSSTADRVEKESLRATHIEDQIFVLRCSRSKQTASIWASFPPHLVVRTRRRQQDRHVSALPKPAAASAPHLEEHRMESGPPDGRAISVDTEPPLIMSAREFSRRWSDRRPAEPLLTLRAAEFPQVGASQMLCCFCTFVLLRSHLRPPLSECEFTRSHIQLRLSSRCYSSDHKELLAHQKKVG